MKVLQVIKEIEGNLQYNADKDCIDANKPPSPGSAAGSKGIAKKVEATQDGAHDIQKYGTTVCKCWLQ